MTRSAALSSLMLIVVGLSAAVCASGKDLPDPEAPKPRYGIPVDLRKYPQGEPRETIRSVIRATQTNDIEYLLAQLIAPREVDAKFRGNRESLRSLAAHATPEKSQQLIADLQRHLDGGTWRMHHDHAWSHVEGVTDLFLQRLGGRWYMHNTSRPYDRGFSALPSAAAHRPAPAVAQDAAKAMEPSLRK